MREQEYPGILIYLPYCINGFPLMSETSHETSTMESKGTSEPHSNHQLKQNTSIYKSNIKTEI